MAANAIEYFGPLNELIQLIYQETYRFVVISRVYESNWTVHVGLVGDEGRWWRGRWVSEDVMNLAGSKASSKHLEAFVDRVVDRLVVGMLFISNWGEEPGREIRLTFDPTGKRPLSMPLTELTAQEAASYASNQFFSVGEFAQKHGCNLIPRGSDVLVPQSTSIDASSQLGSKTHLKRPRTSSPGPSSVPDSRDDEIKALRTRLAQVQAQNESFAAEEVPEAGPSRVVPIVKPQKKSRKVKAMEFASDEDD